MDQKIVQKIKNVLSVSVDGADLTKSRKIEFYVRQGGLILKYVPEVVSANEMIVIIPKSDADRLRHDVPVRLQFAFTDENGNDIPSDIVERNVGELLNPEGYDGN